ncbi:MAG TPA: hypothetical protein VJ943_07015, partial [Desulfotignum sp.]|nr:hypothetical protein [Desulfotignum sp.]
FVFSLLPNDSHEACTTQEKSHGSRRFLKNQTGHKKVSSNTGMCFISPKNLPFVNCKNKM